MQRQIAHIRVRAFPVQMEELRNPRLKSRPVAIAPAVGERAVVQSISETAYQEGIRKGMLLSAARKLCRGVEILPFDRPYYQSGSQALCQTVRTHSALYELSSLGKVHVDWSGKTHNSNNVLDRCWRAVKQVRTEIGIKPSVGVAGNKLVSRIASRFSVEDGMLYVESGKEQEFLNPLKAVNLPAVDDKLWRLMQLIGLPTIGLLGKLELQDCRAVFGKAGRMLCEQAKGVDFSPIIPTKQPQSAYQAIFTPDTNDVDKLRDRLFRLTEDAEKDLRQKQRQAWKIRIDLEYADTKRLSKTARIKKISQESELRKTALELLHKTNVRRVSVRRISLHILETRPLVRQLDIFAQPEMNAKQHLLNSAMDQIKARFGEHVIRQGRLV